jgi:hypothetical protein
MPIAGRPKIDRGDCLREVRFINGYCYFGDSGEP